MRPRDAVAGGGTGGGVGIIWSPPSVPLLNTFGRALLADDGRGGKRSLLDETEETLSSFATICVSVSSRPRRVEGLPDGLVLGLVAVVEEEDDFLVERMGDGVGEGTSTNVVFSLSSSVVLVGLLRLIVLLGSCLRVTTAVSTSSLVTSSVSSSLVASSLTSSLATTGLIFFGESIGVIKSRGNASTSSPSKNFTPHMEPSSLLCVILPL